MAQSSPIKTFFERNRHPGDLVFAIMFLVFSLFLLSRIGSETQWVRSTKLFAQPAFWPAVSLFGMSIFSILHAVGSVVSPQSVGRRKEIIFWTRSFEYVLWFMLYVWTVPYIGYLAASLIFTVSLTFRIGYRNRRMFLAAAAVGFFTVLVFKGLLSVKIPGGEVYEFLPGGVRNFMLIYF